MDEQKLQKIEKLGTFILGGVAGAAAGILFAPRSGRETRGAMSSRAGEARESSREGYFEAWERARERISRMHVPQGPMEEDPAEIQLGPLDEPYPGEPDTPAPEGHPGLRAVPREEIAEESKEPETPGEPERGLEKDPEELRRRIRDTRDRLGKRREPGE